MPVFGIEEAKEAADFLCGALQEYAGHRGIYGEGAAQRLLYGFLIGRFGLTNVEREAPGHKGSIDFVVHGGGRAAIELIVRQPNSPRGDRQGTADQNYILPGGKRVKVHIKDNVRKLMHFRGVPGDTSCLSFLMVVDRHADSLPWCRLEAAYRSAVFRWTGRRQPWHQNTFRLVYASGDTLEQTIIRPTVQTIRAPRP